ncbi:hypothetical protein BJ878DRAFT_8371 [Calycina marina]|uniref:Uncharacterized protein n=1 Tax=Calycina marina TaxID=1763456 RepID=A0A9P7YUA6_9HELO|nr:hypothetical protein BJ878DRAFT_8371 [Calycina marina]
MAPCSRGEKEGDDIAKLCTSPRDKKLNRCGRCAAMNKACDVRDMNRMPSVQDWEVIDADISRMQQQEEEAIAKILRLRKQQRLLLDKKQRMIAAGLNSMDELDALEAAEKSENERAEREAQEQREAAAVTRVEGPSATSGSASLDFDKYGLELDPAVLEMAPKLWGVWDVGGGSPSASGEVRGS